MHRGFPARQANVDIWSFFNVGCLVRSAYLDSAMARVIGPLTIIALLILAGFVFTKLGKEGAASSCYQFMILFTFLIYVSTTNVRL